MIQIRVDTEAKKTLAAAAAARGQTISSFVRDVAMRAANREPPKSSFKGIPTHVRASLATAASGGAHGYEDAGYGFGGAIDQEVPDDEDFDSWAVRTNRLARLCRNGDEEGIAEWLAAAYPKVVELIPERRLPLFCRGVIRRWEAWDTDWAVFTDRIAKEVADDE